MTTETQDLKAQVDRARALAELLAGEVERLERELETTPFEPSPLLVEEVGRLRDEPTLTVTEGGGN